jgi:enamine deaminase RidA (YjgF/YER057c/UK114 family)
LNPILENRIEIRIGETMREVIEHLPRPSHRTVFSGGSRQRIYLCFGSNPVSDTGMVAEDIIPARQVMQNRDAILKAAGSGLDKVVKTWYFPKP